MPNRPYHRLICNCCTCGFICPEHAADRIGGCASCAHFARVFDALKIMLDGNTDKRMVSGREIPSGDTTMNHTPHYTDLINADGTFNRSAIMLIATAHSRGNRYCDSWAKVFARELRTVWQVARGLHSMERGRAA